MQYSFDDAPCLFFAFTDEGLVTAVNTPLCEATGYAKGELVGRNVSQWVTMGTRIFFQTHFFPLLRLKGRAEEIFITLRCKDGGELPVMINVKRTGPDAELIAVGIVIVNRSKYEEGIIAAKKYAETALAENKELQAARAQALQHAEELDEKLITLQQQNENLLQLNWTLAHTMQEPLRKMAIFTSKLLSTQPANPETVLKKINALAVTLQQQFVQLQRYVQMGLQEEEMKAVALQPFVEAVAKPFVQEGHRIDVGLHDCPAIKAHPDQLQTLMYELLANAVRFRKPPAEAEVRIRATVVQANAFRAVKEKYQYADYLKLSVADAGIGFAPQHRERVFHLFTRLDPQSDGFGMGLALCKKIMELHKGFMLAETGDEKETVFSCFFPLSEKESTEKWLYESEK